MLLPGTRTRSWAASILRCCVRKTLKEKTVGAPRITPVANRGTHVLGPAGLSPASQDLALA